MEEVCWEMEHDYSEYLSEVLSTAASAVLPPHLDLHPATPTTTCHHAPHIASPQMMAFRVKS
jgi:hypothetical protein